MSSARRGSDGDGEHSNERWLVSYADFITLMFAFFAVLYATSQKDMEKSKEFQDSVKRYLIKAGGGMGQAGQQAVQGTKGSTPIEPPIQSFTRAAPESAKILDEIEKMVDENLSKEERAKYLTDVAADDWGVRITLPSAPLFSANSEKFRSDALPFLAKLGALLHKTKRKILIEGHVAENETGTFRSTWDFASARSVNFLRYIEKKESLDPTTLATASLADTRPLFSDERKPANSRLEIVLLNPEYEF